MALYDLLKFAHVLAVVFMAIPLFNLIVVNERVSFGTAHVQVDRYFENIIRGGAKRCYVFQLTALVTGLWLAGLMAPWDAVFANPVLLAKLGLLAILTILLSVVHFSLQPRIDAILREVEGDSIPPSAASRIGPLRLQRKRLAAICLFLVVVTILLGMQVGLRFPEWLTATLIAVAALFAWRVYKSRVLYGWI